jgi:hypothetical protein
MHGDLVPLSPRNQLCARLWLIGGKRRVLGRGVDMKISERAGRWIEIDKATDADDEIRFRVPNGMWAGWLAPIFLKEEDLASFLRSVGWQVEVPTSLKRAT